MTALFQMNPEAHGNELYVTYKKIPQFFDARSDTKFGSSKIAPDLQGKVLGHLINELMPDSAIALLLQDEAFYYAVSTGLQEGLGQENARLKIKNEEAVKDSSVNYVERLSNSGAYVLVVLGDTELQRQILRQMDDLTWRPIAFLNDSALSLEKEELEIPGSAVSIASRMSRVGASEEEKLDWEKFRVRVPAQYANSDAAFDGYLQAHALISLLESCYNLERKCLIDNYRALAARSIVRTVFEQGVWKSIGAEEPTAN